MWVVFLTPWNSLNTLSLSSIVCALMPSSGLKKVFFSLQPWLYKKLPRLNPTREVGNCLLCILAPWLRSWSNQAPPFFLQTHPLASFYSAIQKTSVAELCPYGGAYAPRPVPGRRAACRDMPHWDVQAQLHTLQRADGSCGPKGYSNKIWDFLLINTIWKYNYKMRCRALEGQPSPVSEWILFPHTHLPMHTHRRDGGRGWGLF